MIAGAAPRGAPIGASMDGLVLALFALTGVTLPLIVFAVLPAIVIASVARRSS